ncbi:hypothetical protein BDW02DRAFT_627976 [Decorospora gaudefroyi]|uniref:F-box domain-containing protein n=1 Tax=Decorospora gaudefroyi TaxID=184978 RepID=A0A6A5KJR1_9PLEO|nr:hypothetical protein BDW02DRAFT_627976 [Decorospora gaudefroyi]
MAHHRRRRTSSGGTANSASRPPPLFASPRNQTRAEASTTASTAVSTTNHPTGPLHVAHRAAERAHRRSLTTRSRPMEDRDSAFGSPSQRNTGQRQSEGGTQFASLSEHQNAMAAQYGLPAPDLGDALHDQVDDDDDHLAPPWYAIPSAQAGGASARHPLHPAFDYTLYDSGDEPGPPTPVRYSARPSLAMSSADDGALGALHPWHRTMHGAHGDSKRSREWLESPSDNETIRTLHKNGAVAVMLYNSTSPNPEANDVWPEFRSSAKLPVRYYLLDRSDQIPSESDPNWRTSQKKEKKPETVTESNETGDFLPDSPVGRPEWKLPVELVELIAEHLNRDDIKALRLVSRELNRNISQVVFQTVVVPFNTEIYGMLGQEPKPDFKGKRRAGIEKSHYLWRNANGDEVYLGHGLDVFRGFGRHIRKYGMSFEVNEESLSMPPVKSATERKISFWGDYDWPFEEYRRFDAVAGLETTADETPRMKTAFSELSKVRELALSIDSGLGWLNGPDRSIRARILRRPPKVFGTNKPIPDRRAQAQQELWRLIQAYHQSVDSDVRLATLYKMEGQHPLSELKESSSMADLQPVMPYLDPQLIHEATPHDTADLPNPTTFDDPDVLERYVSTPSLSDTGVLFTSTNSPVDGGPLINPVVPAILTKAQKEWLLETEWAQRAFISSYMLSIIDNSTTFELVHALNISALSDRYLPMLNRSDFWAALPNLRDATLMVIPGWRTVRKDEAGFVDTPLVNPTQGLNSLIGLLRHHVACRSNIRNLTVGWVTGGEHAEGLHARNKLLFPAPVMDLQTHTDQGASVTSGMLVETDVTRLRASLLQFPHVERLTLKNCWITPTALLQFVKTHDEHALKDIILDSVSLTDMLRPITNANHAAQQVAHHVALQNATNQQQFLHAFLLMLQQQLQQLQGTAGNVQLQTQFNILQNQLQQQLQLHHMHVPIVHQPQPHGHAQPQQMHQAQPHPMHQAQPHHIHQAQLQQMHQAQLQQMQQAHLQQMHQAQPHTNNNFANIANLTTQLQQLQNMVTAGHQPAATNNQHGTVLRSVLKVKPRQGSWMDIIDQISPGTNLSDFESDHSQADNDRVTALQTIEFRSCGYAKLPNAALDQIAVDAGHNLSGALRHPVLTRRTIALEPAMLSAKWAHLGEIMQDVDLSELAALDAGWNLRTGWDDTEEAQAVEFDGLRPGGTGRFTGIIRQSDKVVDDAAAYFGQLRLRARKAGLES